MNDKTWVPKDEIDKQRAKFEAPRKPKSERKNLGSSSEKSVLSAEDITRLKCLLNIDLRNVSFELSPRIDVSKYSSWFQSVVVEEDVHSCMARSLYFLACDIDLAYEQGICPDISKTPFVGSIYDVQDSMIQLYNNRVKYLSGPMEGTYEVDPILISKIRSCFVSLIAMGFIGDVIDLINFGASMEVLALDVCGSPLIQDLYKVRRRPKVVGDLLKKLRILTPRPPKLWVETGA